MRSCSAALALELHPKDPAQPPVSKHAKVARRNMSCLSSRLLSRRLPELSPSSLAPACPKLNCSRPAYRTKGHRRDTLCHKGLQRTGGPVQHKGQRAKQALSAIRVLFAGPPYPPAHLEHVTVPRIFFSSQVRRIRNRRQLPQDNCRGTPLHATYRIFCKAITPSARLSEFILLLPLNHCCLRIARSVLSIGKDKDRNATHHMLVA